MSVYISPLIWLAEEYLKWNPFFIYGGRDPLLHQTEVVARVLFLRPPRLLVADVIGLGKTITALRILKILQKYRRIDRVLFIVPGILVDQWREEIARMGEKANVIDKKSLEFYRRHSELPAGWYIGSMDRLKKEEYMCVLERGDWDAIIVDEAHKLGLTGKGPNLRLENLGELIREKQEAVLILLSATPHKGKPEDYLARLSLIDPSLLEVASIGSLANTFDNPEYYQRTHNILVFRRNKEDVNKVYEMKEIFKPCNMIAVLVEPNDVERYLLRNLTSLAVEYLGRYYTYMMQTYGWSSGRIMAILSLLRTLLVKRGLSSPQALVKTFGKLVEKRSRYLELISSGYTPDEAEERVARELEEYSKKLDELLSGEKDVENELDEEFERLASRFDIFLDEEFINYLEKTVSAAKKILSGNVVDSKIEALKKILQAVYFAENLPEDFRDLKDGKIIIFTEFKDTAKYIYKNLYSWVEEKLGNPKYIRIFTSENRSEVEEVKKWLAENEPRILITTDVAGEGLNLQYANVLINYEITWSPVRLEQRIGRVWRYGQKRKTYVFNLFLADALEGEVAQVVFSKLYGMTMSLGKVDPILGEEVLLSTIKNELLEHAVEESVVGLIPIEIEFKNKKIALSEMKIIELVTKDAKAFVKEFITALKRLVRELKLKRVYPLSVEAERVRKELKHLTGFADTTEAIRFATNLISSLTELINGKLEEKDNRIILRLENGKVTSVSKSSPERMLEDILKILPSTEIVPNFVFKSDRKEVFMLTSLQIVSSEEILYREPVGISADFESKTVSIYRGEKLLQKLRSVIQVSIPFDEIYGLEDVFRRVPEILRAGSGKFLQTEAKEGALKVIERIKRYENIKELFGGQPFFMSEQPRVEIKEPKFIFLSSALLPSVEEVVSEEVWGWAEEDSIPVVMHYEGRAGREALKVSDHEHYDIKSVRRDKEGNIIDERYIEIKTKMSGSLAWSLTKEEYELAKKFGDKYWIYLVYGVGSKRPVVLAIRNPLKKLRFRKEEAVERRERYLFGV